MRTPEGCSSNVPTCSENQAAIEHAYATLDQGIERARQLQSGQPQWNQGKRQIHAYVSEIDGAILPYGVTLPENYDPGTPTVSTCGCTDVRTPWSKPNSFTASSTAKGWATLPWPIRDRSNSIALAASMAPAGTGPAKGTSSSPSPP